MKTEQTWMKTAKAHPEGGLRVDDNDNNNNNNNNLDED
jgi:hypothetical protein